MDERERGPANRPPDAGARPGSGVARTGGGGEGAHEPERQRTIDALCEAFANDEIEVEEFERRVAVAHRAASSEELRRLLSGLPSGNVPVPASHRSPESDSAPHPASLATAPAPPHADEVSEWGLSVGSLGGVSRTGHWTPARRNVAVAVMGGVELDFREASLPPGVTELFVVAFWGGVEIVVPPWLRVQSSGIGLMGGFDHHTDAPSTAQAGGPVLRISGLALMGGVEIAVRYPGESAKDARRRRKEERKPRKLGSGSERDVEEEG